VSLHELRWRQAEYPYENYGVILELDPDEHEALKIFMDGAIEAGLEDDVMWLPCSPIEIAEFINVFGEELGAEEN